MSGLIEPRVLKGFRDSLPHDEIFMQQTMRKLEEGLSHFGFVPIDTPVLEYVEILLGKGGGDTDKQVYRFSDHGNREVAMRYDLTVPFARFMATHVHSLYLPFKRYHIAKVWRGENTQRGRYREFLQCDFDIVGVDSVAADFEILLLINRCFLLLGIESVSIRVSHRGVFNKLLAAQNEEQNAPSVLRIVDKLAKVGKTKVEELLSEVVAPGSIEPILQFVEMENDLESTLAKMEDLSGGPSDESGRLREIFHLAADIGVNNLVLDPSITRGLDYYTGIVWETFLNRLPELGSLCGGGRYNNLASLYTKQMLPGVGASIGLDRLMAGIHELSEGKDTQKAAGVIVFCLDQSLMSHYFRLLNELQAANIQAEVYPLEKKLSQQLAFAEKKGIAVGIFVGEDEITRGQVNIKNLSSRQSYDGIPSAEAVQTIRSLLHT